jgi:hypothetical protein
MMARAAMTRPGRSLRGKGEKKDHDAVPLPSGCGGGLHGVHAGVQIHLRAGIGPALRRGRRTDHDNEQREAPIPQSCLPRPSRTFRRGVNAPCDATLSYRDHFCDHPFFATLSGMLGLGCHGVGGAILFELFALPSSSANAILSQAVLGGLLLITFGMFASWNSVMGFQRHLCPLGLMGKQGVKSSL